jgi:multidrug efflux pump subunit AcrA (membrane-fusion protein)
MGRTGQDRPRPRLPRHRAGAGYWVYREYWSPDSQATRMPPQKGRGGPMGAGGPTPVVGAPASLGNVDIVMNGLGTATPLRTVTVRSRVDGELMRVLFQEGELVKEGQLLAEIDPRGFKVQLEQAEGQLAKDRALLENAKLDLARYQRCTSRIRSPSSRSIRSCRWCGSTRARCASTAARSTAPAAALVHADRRAGRGPGRPAPGRPGQHRARRRRERAGGDHAAAAVAALFTVPQDSMPAVMRRMQSGEKIPVEAWDREQKAKLADGELVSADNQVDPATGTVKLKAQFGNEDGALFPNQFVNVRMKLDTLRDVVVIPSAAVQRGAQGLFVYVGVRARQHGDAAGGEARPGRRPARRGERGPDRRRGGRRRRHETACGPGRRWTCPARARRSSRPRKPHASGVRGKRKGESFQAFHCSTRSDDAAHRSRCCSRAPSPTGCCRSRRCRQVDYPTIQTFTFYTRRGAPR